MKVVGAGTGALSEGEVVFQGPSVGGRSRPHMAYGVTVKRVVGLEWLKEDVAFGKGNVF